MSELVGHVSGEESDIRDTVCQVLGDVVDLHKVRTICSCSAFTIIALRVGITSGPLEVDAIALAHSQSVGYKVVFNSRVHLHDVATLATHVKVEDPLGVYDAAGSVPDRECEAPVLEGPAVLGGVHGIRQVLVTKVFVGIGADGGVGGVGFVVGVPPIVVPCGDVVADAQDTEVIGVIRNGPVVGIGIGSDTIAQMVVTAQRSCPAVGARGTVGICD